MNEPTNFYAGVGARKTPKAILHIMNAIGKKLAEEGWTLRSGGAAGADQAFAYGAQTGGGQMEIFRPGSSNWDEQLHTPSVRKYHPAPDRLSPYVTKLMARNSAQVLGGYRESPRSTFLMCWADYTERHFDAVLDMKDCAGGTGQAVRIAYAEKVPVYNLAHPAHLKLIEAWLHNRGPVAQTG